MQSGKVRKSSEPLDGGYCDSNCCQLGCDLLPDSTLVGVAPVTFTAHKPCSLDFLWPRGP